MGAKLKVAVGIGTRPEAIKMAPVIMRLRKDPEHFEPFVFSTGQHRQMLDQVLSLFHLSLDADLRLMRDNQRLTDLAARALREGGILLNQHRPDVLLVQGDTATATALALAAFYERIPVGHVEAGLRSHDLQNPFPEEANRKLISVVADMHFAPTPRGRRELEAEGHDAESVAVTGNTAIDALLTLAGTTCDWTGTPLEGVDMIGRRLVLVTSHRRENQGQGLARICEAIAEIAARFPDVVVLYPVHLNPNVRQVVMPRLGRAPGVLLCDPLDYVVFVRLLCRASLVLTDSGGVQEEAPTFHVPVLVMRELTERPEAFEAGMSRMVGTDTARIVEQASLLLTDPAAHAAMAQGQNPYGDGRAADRICQALLRNASGLRPLLSPKEEFHP